MPRLIYPVWTLAIPLATIAVELAAPPERRLLMTLVAAFVFAATQWLVARSRFRGDNYFSPVNIALALMLIKTVVSPILLMLAGPTNDLFIGVPSRASMEAAIGVDVVAFVALSIGIALAPAVSKPIRALSTTPSASVTLAFAALGLIGLVLAFGSLGASVAYLLNPSASAQLQPGEATWSGLLGSVLRPFLAFALIAWWARSVDRTKHSWTPMLIGAIAAIGITLANMTYSFNRAAFAFPLLAMLAVWNARIKRVPPAAAAGAIVIALPLLFLLGAYRAKILAPPTAPPGVGVVEGSLREVSATVQEYAGGPNLTALLFDSSNWGERLQHGSSLVASALSPVPTVGKSFRAESGSAIYNLALYGAPGFEDQIIPFSAELFVNFHAWGVALGFFALGQVVARAQGWFTAAQSAFGAFAIQYVGIWIAMLSVWSFGIFSQIAIYFLAPVYGYWAAMKARDWLRGIRAPRLANSY